MKEIRKVAQKANNLLLKIMEKSKDSSVEFMEILPVLKVLLTEK